MTLCFLALCASVGSEKVSTMFISVNNHNNYFITWMYRDSVVDIAVLRAGLSEDLILMKTRFLSPVQTSPGTHPTSWNMDAEFLCRE